MINNLIFPLPSAVLLAVSFYIYIKYRHSLISKLAFALIALTVVVLLLTYGVAYYFTGNGVDEATLYHLEYGVAGAGFGEYKYLIIGTVLLLIFSISFLLFKLFQTNKTKSPASLFKLILCFVLLLCSFLLNPTVIDIYKLQSGNSYIASDNTVLENKTTANEGSDFYDYYTPPKISKKEGENQKNIVYIYAESLERTYFDEEAFPGLIKELRTLESRATSFTNIKSAQGTGWTIGGMTASQCGIPLFTPSHGNSMSGMDRFLSSARCLGDLLSDENYYLSYFGGSSTDFAGKGKFYKTHGFDEVNGREILSKKLPDESYQSNWGLYDDSLFGMAYERYEDLSASGDKFGLFVLTLDTHHPKGHPSKECKDIKYKDGENPILNSVACSDFLISKFIKKIEASPLSDETLIVLTSDHLALRNTAFDLLKKSSKGRRNLFLVIDPNKNEAEVFSNAGTSLDVGTTILPFIGYDGSIGLGRNLMALPKDDASAHFIRKSLKRWKQHILTFWDFPKLTKSLKFNHESKTIFIENREFKTPVFIELDKNFNTTLKFNFHQTEKDKLIQYQQQLSSDMYSLLITKCKDFSSTDLILNNADLCLFASKGSVVQSKVKLKDSFDYSVKEIKNLLKIN